jgi:N-methylhydantoinase A
MTELARGKPVAPWRIGIDVGGTFTDLVLVDANGLVWASKTPSVPANPAQGVMAAIAGMATSLGMPQDGLLGHCAQFIHGTTVATNLLLERKGAKVGLLCTAGFRDTLEIRRGYRPDMWDHRTPWQDVLVPRSLRRPVIERMNARGEVLQALDEASVREAAALFAAEGVEAVAICLLHSYANDAHELRCQEIVRSLLPGVYVTCSSEVAPVMGEFERASTAAANAYAAPRVLPYLQELAAQLKATGLKPRLLLVQSNGGAISLDQLTARPASLALSGPAAGLASLELFGRLSGTANLISIEIGGTSCDVTVVTEGRVATVDSLSINEIVIAMPSVDIHTIGTGGGTICTADGSGMIRFGPEGAGARPGPACYGRGGTLPTVTDAHLLLGHLRAGSFSGGHITLDETLAAHAMDAHMAKPLSATVPQAAAAMLRIADQNICHAIEEVSLERGLDPARYTLVAAGGAGALHAVEVARQMGMARVFVPRLAGVFCALGMCNARVRHDLVRAIGVALTAGSLGKARREAAQLAARGLALLEGDGFAARDSRLEHRVDLRYAGQQWTIGVPLAGEAEGEAEGEAVVALHAAFDALHMGLYGSSQPEAVLELVSARVAAFGLLPPMRSDAAPPGRREPPVPVAVRAAVMGPDAQALDVPVYAGASLEPGHSFLGPAIVEEQTTTLLVGAGDRASIDAFGNYVIDIRKYNTGARP